MARQSSKYFESVIQKLIAARQSEKIAIDESFKAELRGVILQRASVLHGAVPEVKVVREEKVMPKVRVSEARVSAVETAETAEVLEDNFIHGAGFAGFFGRFKYWFALVPSALVVVIVLSGTFGPKVTDESTDNSVSDESSQAVEVQAPSNVLAGTKVRRIKGDVSEDAEVVMETSVARKVARIVPSASGTSNTATVVTENFTSEFVVDTAQEDVEAYIASVNASVEAVVDSGFIGDGESQVVRGESYALSNNNYSEATYYPFGGGYPFPTTGAGSRSGYYVNPVGNSSYSTDGEKKTVSHKEVKYYLDEE